MNRCYKIVQQTVGLSSMSKSDVVTFFKSDSGLQYIPYLKSLCANKYIKQRATLQHFRKYMKMRGKQIKDLTSDWKEGNLISSRQKDGHSCGPFVLMVSFESLSDYIIVIFNNLLNKLLFIL